MPSLIGQNFRAVLLFEIRQRVAFREAAEQQVDDFFHAAFITAGPLRRPRTSRPGPVRCFHVPIVSAVVIANQADSGCRQLQMKGVGNGESRVHAQVPASGDQYRCAVRESNAPTERSPRRRRDARTRPTRTPRQRWGQQRLPVGRPQRTAGRGAKGCSSARQATPDPAGAARPAPARASSAGSVISSRMIADCSAMRSLDSWIANPTHKEVLT